MIMVMKKMFAMLVKGLFTNDNMVDLIIIVNN